MNRPVKVVLAKPGLDGHDQGAKVVARALMDAGCEVVYTGLRQTPTAVARIAREEDADVIALSSMAGSHVSFCEELKPLLEQAGLADRLWIIGGNLPSQDGKYSLYCAVIVKQVDAKTRAKTSINELLRGD